MSEVSDEPIKKLSEAITENNEIITEASALVKEMKGLKDINDDTIDKYKKECNELIADLDDIIDVMESCQQEDDPTFKSFDSKKKTSKSNAEKSKKLLLDTLTKMEKSLQKNKESESKKTKGILKNSGEKDNDADKNKKSGKDKNKDPDALSLKSGAGSSGVGDIEEIEDDLASEAENDKKKEDEKKDEKNISNGKKKEKDKQSDIVNGESSKKTEKKDKEKSNKNDDSKLKEKEIANDSQSEGSIVVEDEEKPKKGSKLKGLKLTKEDKTNPKNDKKDKSNKEQSKKNKIKKDAGKDAVGITNENSLSENEIDDDNKSDDNDAYDVKNIDNKEEEKKHKEGLKKKDSSSSTKSKKDKNKGDDENQIVHEYGAESVAPEKKKREKKNIDKKLDETQSKGDDVEDKNKKNKNDDEIQSDKKEDSSKPNKKDKDKKVEDEVKSDKESKKKDKDKKSDKESKKKDKDKKSEDEGKSDKESKKKDKDKKSEEGDKAEKEMKKKDKDKKSEDSVKSDKQSKKKETKAAEIKGFESDQDIVTPSLRTQESLKSDFSDDFESDDEEQDNIKETLTVKQAVITESKPSSSLTRQHVINSDDDENANVNKPEDELAASSKFENIDGFYVVTKRFDAEGEDDLAADVGEKMTILDINDDGWWLARNESGDEGFVPMSCLKPLIESTNIHDSIENDDRPENAIIPKELKPELKEKEHDEGTQLWDQIRRTMKEKSNEEQKGLSDVLKAFGALPAGFRFSTLAAWSTQNRIECSMKAQLCPKLSDSDLSFKDIQYDAIENKIRPRPVRIQRIVQIVKSIQMAPISDKFVVKSRHVRMCLFNGEKAISNIHTMRATINEKDMKTWNFNSKITDTTNSLDFNEIFIRSNYSSTDISLLLEFCMLGFKSKQPVASSTELDNAARKSVTIKINEEFADDELVEFSAGWAKIPLYDENGQLITNKNADYELFGGTPYEEGLEVDPTNARTATGSKFKTLMNQSKQPQVSVRISLPSKDNKDLIESLPDVIVGSTLHLTNLSFYRRILAEELMDRRQNLTSAEPIYSPFLVSFLAIADSPDILDVMRTVWIEKGKSIKSLDKKDYGKMNKIYQDAYMEYIYPLTKVKSLRPSSLAHSDTEQIRSVKIKEFVQRVKSDKLSVLLSGDYSFEPVSFEEFSYKIVSKYSTALKI